LQFHCASYIAGLLERVGLEDDGTLCLVDMPIALEVAVQVEKKKNWEISQPYLGAKVEQLGRVGEKHELGSVGEWEDLVGVLAAVCDLRATQALMAF